MVINHNNPTGIQVSYHLGNDTRRLPILLVTPTKAIDFVILVVAKACLDIATTIRIGKHNILKAVGDTKENDPGNVYRVLIQLHDLTIPQNLRRGVHGMCTG